MAVTPAHLLTESSTTDSVGFTTASVSPSVGKLVLVAVQAASASNVPDLSISGAGLTWANVVRTPSGTRSLQIFRAMGTPTPGALTISGDGSTLITSAVWEVAEFGGIDTSGTNGSGAIAQAFADRPANGASVNYPFPTAPAAGNATYGAVGATSSNESQVPGSGWSLLAQGGVGGPLMSLLTEVAVSAQSAVTASWTTSGGVYVAGVELKAAPAGGLNKLRLGAGTVSLRYGSSAVSKAYLGTAQIWP